MLFLVDILKKIWKPFSDVPQQFNWRSYSHCDKTKKFLLNLFPLLLLLIHIVKLQSKWMRLYIS